MQFNIVLYYNINNSLSKIKAKIIKKNTKLILNILLIVNILLIINNLRYKFKNKLISTIYYKSKKIIYINN